MPPATAQQFFALGLEQHQAGRLAEAEAHYRQVLSLQPDHADALHYLGVIAHQAGRHDVAERLILKAIALHPNNPAAHSNLGAAYRQARQFEKAVASYRRALEFQPDFPEIHHNLGLAFYEWRQFDDAVTAFHRALQLKPDYADAHNNLGLALIELGRLDDAVASFRRAIQLHPRHERAYFNLGNALKLQNLLDHAIAAYQQAIQIKPHFANTHNNLGVALAEQGWDDEAMGELQRAVQLQPNYPAAHNNLGNVLKSQGKIAEAAAAYQQALGLQPDYAVGHYNLGNVLREQGRLDEAVASFRNALQLRPDHKESYVSLGNTLKDQGQLHKALSAYRQAVQLQPDDAVTLSTVAYTLHFLPGQNAEAIAEVHRCWNQRLGALRKQFIRPHSNTPDPERCLRVGYVSPDFRQHVVGRNLVPLFQYHNREHFEILCYSGVANPDDLTEDFRRAAHRWSETTGVTDETLAATVREDGVDILVDLTQHMADNRLPVFARQPAPVQVSFAGYPAGAGVEAIGYRISDRFLESDDPSAQLPGTEQVCLVESFWCYDPRGFEAKISDLPARATGHVTFGSLNNFCKLNEAVFQLWARVLTAVKGSRLILLSPEGRHRQQTLELMEANGVAAHRLEFVAPLPYVAYLEMHHRLDIALDPFPYGGHTTSLDALWMGVPVVSLVGSRSVSRAGLSQLSNLGLPELAAFSEDEYVAIAAQLAGDLPRLAEMRATLRPRMKASPLMDAEAFTRGIEAAFRTMWRQWCAR